MNMKSLRTSVAAAMGGAVLVGGLLLGASIALAQSSDDTSDTTTTAEDTTTDEVRSRDGCNHLDDLASELGIDIDELRQQIEDGASIPDLLEELGIDPESFMGDFRFRGFRDFDGELPFLGRHGSWLGDLDLDIDLQELRDKVESGLSLDEALTEIGVDVDSLLEDARQAALDKIDELVVDGTITEERADELREMIESFELGDRLPFGRGFHFDFDGEFDGHRFRGRHGDGYGFLERDDAGDSTAEGALLDV